MKIPKIRHLYKVTLKTQYIPENPWRKWGKKGDVSYYHSTSKKELLGLMEPEARKLYERGKIKIEKLKKVI